MTTENWIDLPTLQDVAKAQAENWEIEYRCGDGFATWSGMAWQKSFTFRGRPRQPKMKEVKILSWIDPQGEFRRGLEGSNICKSAASGFWIRQPHLDMIAQVAE